MVGISVASVLQVSCFANILTLSRGALVCHFAALYASSITSRLFDPASLKRYIDGLGPE